MGESADDRQIKAFIDRWSHSSGAERANYQLFLSELTDIIGVPRPDPAGENRARNDYVFERAVDIHHPDGTATGGRIDLYKRGCFVLEAKQSRLKDKPKAVEGAAEQQSLFPEAPRGATRAPRAWDVLMLNARTQAEQYAKALPADHGWPPFLLLVDVGHVIEAYADFTGQGKHYDQFPDRQGFRIHLADLVREDVRERLRLIWTDPHALDPTRRALKVTRAIAERLARVSQRLEARGFAAEPVAAFLMRCLFTMFAEDVGLIPKASFKDLLARCEGNPEAFPHKVGQLWEAMDQGGYALGIETQVRRFNGRLFKDRAALPLDAEEIQELRIAAQADWREVEPAIFGTLLEQALDPKERQRLGAHYTPRAYVERLVNATVMEPLRADWANTLTAADRRNTEGDPKGAREIIKAFHDCLSQTRVLDPACGTGNFLYVAMALMKRLEGEVIEAFEALGGQDVLALDKQGVDPHQFLGLELNPRAAAITELVLWIGYLQWYFRIRGGEFPGDPVLKAFANVNFGSHASYDAVLDATRTLKRDAAGRPVTDAEGRAVEVFANPKPAAWPEAEFIVGNPPFIGGKDLRGRLGEAYAEALWKAHRKVNPSADFVMFWWDQAAERLLAKKSPLRRFGFVTTNSITQTFQRRVIERHMGAKRPLRLVMAVADHPWTKAAPKSAAVRIAMTVAEAVRDEAVTDGVLYEVTAEAGLDTDEPQITTRAIRGRINADLTVGADATRAVELRANERLSSPGVKLHGAGFIVTPTAARHLGLGRVPGLDAHIRSYRNGRDLAGTPRHVMVIDLFGLTEEDVRRRFPETWQHLIETVRVDRQTQAAKSPTADALAYAETWWLHGKPRQELRKALAGLPRYIATVETSKHRWFTFLDAAILPDNRLVCFALADGFSLGVLSSRIHVDWALAVGSTLEDRPIYTKSLCFDPFPFPDPSAALRAEIAALAEELDAHRKARQAAHPKLTLTQMYNALEAVRAGRALSAEEERVKHEGLILVLRELHDRIDAAVAAAYGWAPGLSAEEIVARLVALNAARAAEEAKGHVRWLRPEYQAPAAGLPVPKRDADEQRAPELALLTPDAGKPAFPSGDFAQTAAVVAAMALASGPLDAAAIARAFRQGARVRGRIEDTLKALVRHGRATRSPEGYRLLRG